MAKCDGWDNENCSGVHVILKLCAVCIRYCGNVSTEPLPSNVHIKTHRLMEGIYGVSRWDGLRSHDIHTEFHKDWFRHSKVDQGRHTDRQHDDGISLILFFKNKKSRLKIGRDLEENGPGSMEVLSWYFPEGTEENQEETSVRLANVPAGNQTE
jgi:hypothetical protein